MAYKVTIQSLIDDGRDVRGLRVEGSGVCGTISYVNEVGGVYIVGNPTVYDARHLHLRQRKVLNAG
jgi:hypothetical protein